MDWEMVQSAKCLSYEHVDPSSIPKTHVKKLGVAIDTCDSPTELLVSLAEQAGQSETLS